MRHGSLFSGIGGFDLAAQWMGWENVFHCENNPFCQKILKHYWPDAKSYGDIKQTDFSGWIGKVDIVSGGFPCQPFSKAGKRKGNDDDRYLWPEMLRAINEIRPAWVVGENVTGIKKMALNLVLTQLEDSGYKTEVFIIPASAVGAWHRRERVWIVANLHSDGCSVNQIKEGCYINKVGSFITEDSEPANINSKIMEGHSGYEYSREEWENAIGRNGESYWTFPWPQIAAGFCRDNDGISNRMDRIKALGNAVVPQVVFEIFKAIEKANENT